MNSWIDILYVVLAGMIVVWGVGVCFLIYTLYQSWKGGFLKKDKNDVKGIKTPPTPKVKPPKPDFPYPRRGFIDRNGTFWMWAGGKEPKLKIEEYDKLIAMAERKGATPSVKSPTHYDTLAIKGAAFLYPQGCRGDIP